MVTRDLGELRLCPFCGAHMLQSEGLKCCDSGRHVARQPPPPPRELLRWEGPPGADPWLMKPPGKHLAWKERTAAPAMRDMAGLYMAQSWSEASRRMNNHFSFTSIGTDTGPKPDDGPDDEAENQLNPLVA